MNYTIAQVEDAVLAALADMEYVKTLETYQGTLEDFIAGPDVNIVKFPAVMVLFAGSEYRHDSYPRGVARQEMRFEIIMAAASLRKEEERRRGSSGTYQMLQDIRNKLDNKRLGLNIAPLSVISERPLFNNKIGGHMLSVYSAVYETTVDYTAAQ